MPRLTPVRAQAQRLLGGVEERAGITRSGLLLLAVAVLGWLAARALGSRAVFLIAYGLLLAVVVSWSAGRRPAAVAASRSALTPRVRAGQAVDVDVELRPRRRAASVLLEERLPAPLGGSLRIPVTTLAAGHTHRHRYRFVARQRGVYQIGPLLLTRTDPFGLTTRRTVLAAATELIVHPTTEPVTDRIATRQWEDPPVRPPVSKPWPTGFELYGLRDYQPGDDPRRIAWRASARMTDPVTLEERYVVRESEQGITDRVALVLDTDARSHSPGEPSETFETAVRVVASLGARHLHDGFSVTLDTGERRLLAGLRGERDRIRLLDALAGVQRGSVPLAGLVERLVADRRRWHLHTVVVTGELELQAAARLRRLAARESLLVVLIRWPDADPASARRAAALGAGVVEVTPGAPLQEAFARLVGAGVRRER